MAAREPSIVAIGGGEIGRPGKPIETEAIDREVIRLTGRRHPRLVFLPTASGDSKTYVEAVQAHFGARLGCSVDSLLLIGASPSTEAIRRAVSEADIVYVGGGNTLRMMRIWRRLGLDALLREAHARGTVLSGLSAGAICWFRHGSSDSRKRQEGSPLIRVSGLGLVPALLCPHYDVEPDRRPSLRGLMARTGGVALALDNCCAVQIVGGRYRIVASREGAHAYKAFWSRGAYEEVRLEPSSDYRPLSALLARAGGHDAPECS